MPTVVERIGDYAHHLKFSDLDPGTVDYAKRLLLDSLACALGGLQGEPVRIVRDTVGELGGAPQATLLGQGRKTNVALAALANGVAVRYLDYNDVYFGPAWTAHPSDTIGALLAAAEWCERSGQELLTAMVIAYEVQMRFSDLPVARNLWHEGWDHSASCAYASAVGVAKLLGLDGPRIAHAVALSGARANTLSEIRVGDIPMDKALSAPVAAANSVLYGLLAKRGFTGCRTLLEGRHGFQHAVARGTDVGPLVPEKGRYLINKVGMKPFPVEGMTIPMAQAALEVHKMHQVRPEEVESIRILTHEEAITKPSWTPEKLRPTTKETADHSFPYCVAVALVAGEVTPRQFGDDWLRNEAVARLIGLTRLEATPDLTEVYRQGHRPAAVEVKTARGTFLREVRYPLGDPKNPMSWDDVAGKFTDQAGPVLGKRAARRVIELAQSIEKLANVRGFIEQLGARAQ